MAKGPAVVIVARHGARLDAADKSWHLTSPTPYDPPLSYGGWTQAKNLGLRIACMLHESPAISPSRRRRIVLHSSPYLRCIQTSTAIAAGISQYQPPASSTKPHTPPDKIALRIDAFLGEWLCPDYFEDITPPPNSTLMVAGAKADLLRNGEYPEIHQSTSPSHGGHFPGGWARSPGPPMPTKRQSPQDGSGAFPSMSSLAHALTTHHHRSSSQGSTTSHTSEILGDAESQKAPVHTYTPPVPRHAVAPSDPIPRGFTAHARDACLNIDFHWDSMRAPLEWGDGGEYGDEWSTMHNRFRKGLRGIMSWYSSPEGRSPGPWGAPATAEDEEEDLVLILVTHGAGCNALIGAISKTPFLTDIGLASLSMAVRREEPRRPSNGSAAPAVAQSDNEYDMKLLASVDHLRPGVNPSELPKPPAPTVVIRPSKEYRKKLTSGSGNNTPIDSPLSPIEQWKPVNSSLGSMRRSSSSGSSRALSNNLGGSLAPTLGLWGSGLKTPIESDEGRKSPGYDMVLNFQNHKPAPSNRNGNISQNAAATTINGHNAFNNTNNKKEENDNISPLPNSPRQAPSQSANSLWNGDGKPKAPPQRLWGPPRLDELAERAVGHKRRWTVTDVNE